MWTFVSVGECGDGVHVGTAGESVDMTEAGRVLYEYGSAMCVGVCACMCACVCVNAIPKDIQRTHRSLLKLPWQFQPKSVSLDTNFPTLLS